MVGPQPIMTLNGVTNSAGVAADLQNLVTTTKKERQAVLTEQGSKTTTLTVKKNTTIDDETRKQNALQKRLDKINAEEGAAAASK